MTTATPRSLRLNAADNIVVCIDKADPGTQIGKITAAQRIPRGHKIATEAIPAGAPVRKFGQIIGFAKEEIAPGSHVHEHNCSMGDFERDYAYASETGWQSPSLEGLPTHFDGYRRANGKVGTRNYIGILTSVNCAASAAKFIARAAEEQGLLDGFDNIDGVVSFVHGTGCAMNTDGEGYELFKRTLWGHAAHPNLGGVILVGLGCEVFQIPPFMKAYGLEDGTTFRSMTIQANGGTRKTIEQGLEVVKEMLPVVNAAKREAVPVSELSVALQCGGSDGYSGITANPALGYAADLVVAAGGTAILAETPEIYGAEHLLTRRATSSDVGKKLVDLIHWWEAYTARTGANMNNNPSPGNKAGGLTTILEKSLGAAAKGGTSPLTGVYGYAEQVTERGFVFMNSPGYDPASITGQVASGANVVTFTTGRGSAYGCKPVPSLKLATNSEMFAHMEEDMDINCGDILDGTSLEEKGREIFRKIVATASGAPSKSEALGYGDNEFVPWHIGAVM